MRRHAARPERPARNVLGFQDAQHAEYDPYASDLFISALTWSLAGREMELRLAAGSQVAAIYGTTTVTERYYGNVGVHPDRVAALASGPLRIVGADAEGEVRVVELPGHPFFIGTLYVPHGRGLSPGFETRGTVKCPDAEVVVGLQRAGEGLR